jgi:phage-related protein (TIGR01555 family)
MEAQQLSLFKGDGWKNAFAGLSGKSDKTQHTYFGAFSILDDAELSSIWLGEGLSKKIVSAPADDMVKNWIDINGDDDGKIAADLTKLEAKSKINEALKWMRLYRGAVIVMGIKDGGQLEDPVNLNRLSGKQGTVQWLKVFSASRVLNTQLDIITDPDSPYFEDIETFKIQKLSGGVLEVHRSRCLVFKGEPIPDSNITGLSFNHRYWGSSALQSAFESIKNFGAISQSVANLMMEFVIGKYTISNLAELLAEDNTKALYTRMEIINASKSTINGVLLAENEKYERDSANVGGIGDIIDRFMMMLSATVEIPVTRLFGRSPAGENATGESDLRNYYDFVTARQESQLLFPLQYLVFLVGTSVGNKKPIISFNSVWEPTLKELIEMRNSQAETDQIYMQNQVVSPDEIRDSRFGGKEYSFETEIEGELTPKETEPEEEPEEE